MDEAEFEQLQKQAGILLRVSIAMLPKMNLISYQHLQSLALHWLHKKRRRIDKNICSIITRNPELVSSKSATAQGQVWEVVL